MRPLPWTSWHVGQETTPVRDVSPSGPILGNRSGSGRDAMTFVGCPPRGRRDPSPFASPARWQARQDASPLSPVSLGGPHIHGDSPPWGRWHGSHTLFPAIPRRSCGVRTTVSWVLWQVVHRRPSGRYGLRTRFAPNPPPWGVWHVGQVTAPNGDFRPRGSNRGRSPSLSLSRPPALSWCCEVPGWHLRQRVLHGSPPEIFLP
jgi:hypothetical protein